MAHCNQSDPERGDPQRVRRGTLCLLLVAAAVGVIAVSCGTVTRTVMSPPNVPGAAFVGSAACVDCHESICKDFKTSTHGGLMAEGTNALPAGCESCHGPGSLHAESGEPRTIVNPRKSPEVCFECHLDKRGEFNMPSHHPVAEGRMSCLDCHPVHKGPARKGGGTLRLTDRGACLACHTGQHGPYVFEHEALREGCATCHRAHGSVNAKLLTQRNATLCLKCHFQQQSAGAILIGGQNHTAFLRQGTCWSAGCHEAVHGSQVNSSLRY